MSIKSLRPWAIIRRIQYTISFFLFWAVVGGFVYLTNFYQPANCFDNLLNGDERGIDCGGGCTRICAADVVPPRVVWANSFKVTEGQYNTVAYVENQNQTAATPELKYTFQLISNGEVIVERSGVTVLPPNSSYPIFEGRIFTNRNLPITETKVILEPVDLWLPSSVGRDQFRTVDIDLSDADNRPQLDVVIENTALVSAEDIEVVATIFNEAGIPVTASKTFMEKIDARSTQDLVFTWPHPIAKTVRSCIVPTDVVLAIDLSGSMNNDGGAPPQPITDALQAAAGFATALAVDDQIAVVTFATDARLEVEFTTSFASISNLIQGLQIEAAEETGFTNTIAALETARAELVSSRHNLDARRVLVLLTDGLPTVDGDEDVVTLAEEIADSLDGEGIEIYAIGLGENVDRDFVLHIASSDQTAYFAPSGADLKGIYDAIKSSLCESGPTKIDVIAKPKTNFAPLQ